MGPQNASWKPPDARAANGDRATATNGRSPRGDMNAFSWKTFPCRYGANLCRFGKACRYAHSDEELRAALKEANTPNGSAPNSPRASKPNSAYLLKAAKKSQKVHRLYDYTKVNSDEFVPILKKKFHAGLTPQSNVHPYYNELMSWCIPESQLQPKLPIPYSKIDRNNLLMINTKDELHFLKRILNGVPMFAVDVEHHSFRSYRGFVCLLQISTRDTDFIIDPFEVWHDLHILNEPFTDPNILKVLHGARSDITWLQRDFGIYIVNMFDTQKAMRLLQFPKLGLSYLVDHYCNVTLEKQFQRADWRYRPLTDQHIDYARKDTHYLLYCYDLLRNELINKGEGYLDEAYNESRKTCLLHYSPQTFDPEGYRKMIGFESLSLNNRQLFLLEKLWMWRDIKARELDECVEYVMSKADMLKTVGTMPATFSELSELYTNGNQGHPLIANKQTILEFVLEALQLPLVVCEEKEEEKQEREDVHTVQEGGVKRQELDTTASFSIGSVSVCIVLFVAVLLRLWSMF